MNLIDEIKKHSLDSKIAVILRHGDRDQIPPGEFGNDIILNKKGQLNAIEFGRKMREYPINRIYTSPIERCVQSAELISKGYESDLEIKTTKSLGAPGLHIADEKIAGESYLAYGTLEILNSFIAGKNVPGIHDSKHFAKVMTQFVKESTTDKGLTLFITHDSLVSLYHFCLDGTIYTSDNWVKYLNGIVIKFDD